MASKLKDRKRLADAAQAERRAGQEAAQRARDEGAIKDLLQVVSGIETFQGPIIKANFGSRYRSLFTLASCQSVLCEDRAGAPVSVGAAVLDLLACLIYRSGGSAEDLEGRLNAEICFSLTPGRAAVLLSQAAQADETKTL